MYSETTECGTGEQARQTKQASLLLRHIALACVGRLLFAEPDVAPVGAEQVYLYNHYEPLRDVSDPAQLLTQLLERPAPADRHIVELARRLNLSHAEVMALVLALMVEEEPMMGRVLAHIQAPVGGSRPALGLLEAALAPLNNDAGWVSGAGHCQRRLAVAQSTGPAAGADRQDPHGARLGLARQTFGVARLS